jgi:hypothetical protein
MHDKALSGQAFYMDDHAMLYAYLLKNAEETCGERGNEASVKGTILYGKERGLRMAMRCTADGRPLTPRNYLLYGEWADDRKWSETEVGVLHPFVLNFTRCGWSDTWKKYGMEKYGAVYCAWVDEALVTGFNPENALRIDKTRPQGADICSFGFIGADFDSAEDFKKDGELKAEIRPRTVRGFLYHTAHLLSAMRRNYLVELGLPKTEEIVSKALTEYAAQFGQEKTDAIVHEAKQDFLVV